MVYSGISETTKAFHLTEHGLEVIQKCEEYPPVGDNGLPINVNFPHLHYQVEESACYEEICNIVQHNTEVVIKDFRI